jgi:hypothetical protein
MQPQDTTGEILARFPGPVTLNASRKKWIVILLGCGAFVAIGVWMTASGQTEDKIYGWGGLVFFGLGMVVAAIAMLPGASMLKLDRERFEVTSLYRRQSYRWQDTTGFEAVQIPPARQKTVAFDDVNAKKKALARLNVGLVGRNSGLPDTYGLYAADLANLMAQWRARAVSQR